MLGRRGVEDDVDGSSRIDMEVRRAIRGWSRRCDEALHLLARLARQVDAGVSCGRAEQRFFRMDDVKRCATMTGEPRRQHEPHPRVLREIDRRQHNSGRNHLDSLYFKSQSGNVVAQA
jgi:hypothetical protein